MRGSVGGFFVPGILFIALQSTPPVPVPILTRAQGLERILALPEVQDLEVMIPERSGGEASLFVMDDGDEAPGIWTYFVGEEHPTHVTRTYTMRLSSFTGEIGVWDWSMDSCTPYEIWRRQEER